MIGCVNKKSSAMEASLRDVLRIEKEDQDQNKNEEALQKWCWCGPD